MSRPGRVRDTELVTGRRTAQVGSYRGKKPPGNASPAQATRDKISDANSRSRHSRCVGLRCTQLPSARTLDKAARGSSLVDA